MNQLIKSISFIYKKSINSISTYTIININFKLFLRKASRILVYIIFYNYQIVPFLIKSILKTFAISFAYQAAFYHNFAE